jgi:hypothetical protein
MVFIWPFLFKKPSMFTCGMPEGGWFSPSHSYIILAILVFLQTRMNTGGLGSSFTFSHSRRSSSHRPASKAMGVLAYFRMASGLAPPFLPPRSAAVSLGRIQRQILK